MQALETTAQDIRFAARALAKSPGFTAAAVAALALGSGANTAIVSVADAVLLRPLPYRDPERLVVILHRGTNPVAPANFRDWQEQASSFESMGAAEFWTPNLTGGDVPEKLWALRITPEILPLLGVPPRLGRAFTVDRCVPSRKQHRDRDRSLVRVQAHESDTLLHDRLLSYAALASVAPIRGLRRPLATVVAL
jgi:hypothetical protein